MTKLVEKSLFFGVLAGVCLSLSAAQASSLVYQPMNNAIFPDAPPGGNAALLASTVRPSNPRSSGFGGGSTDAQILRQSLLGQLSSKLNQAILGTGGVEGTRYPLGDGTTVEFSRNLLDGTKTVTFRDSAGNPTTVVTIPDL